MQLTVSLVGGAKLPDKRLAQGWVPPSQPQYHPLQMRIYPAGKWTMGTCFEDNLNLQDKPFGARISHLILVNSTETIRRSAHWFSCMSQLPIS